jgi:hypothetical protein
MFRRWIQSWFGRARHADAFWTGRFEIVASPSQPLCIRPLIPELEVCELQRLLERLYVLSRRDLHYVRFDFSFVTKFVGPWGAHFAALSRTADDLAIEIEMTGLNSQPAGLAWLFRRSREMRRVTILINGSRVAG